MHGLKTLYGRVFSLIILSVVCAKYRFMWKCIYVEFCCKNSVSLTILMGEKITVVFKAQNSRTCAAPLEINSFEVNVIEFQKQLQ